MRSGRLTALLILALGLETVRPQAVAASAALETSTDPSDLPSFAGPSKVALVQTERGWQLLRDGRPFPIRGAGGTNGSLDVLARSGANSVRTWGTDGLEETLDAAARLKLTVLCGIWLGHERHGFDYTNADKVSEQVETVRRAVLRFRAHPA